MSFASCTSLYHGVGKRCHTHNYGTMFQSFQWHRIFSWYKKTTHRQPYIFIIAYKCFNTTHPNTVQTQINEEICVCLAKAYIAKNQVFLLLISLIWFKWKMLISLCFCSDRIFVCTKEKNNRQSIKQTVVLTKIMNHIVQCFLRFLVAIPGKNEVIIHCHFGRVISVLQPMCCEIH